MLILQLQASIKIIFYPFLIDFLEFFAEIDLLAVLSACPGGDCGSSHSSDDARCYPLKIEVFKPTEQSVAQWQGYQKSAYNGQHRD